MTTKLKAGQEWSRYFWQHQNGATETIADFADRVTINALEFAVEIAESVAKEEDNRTRGAMASPAYQVGCRNVAKALFTQIEELKKNGTKGKESGE